MKMLKNIKKYKIKCVPKGEFELTCKSAQRWSWRRVVRESWQRQGQTNCRWQVPRRWCTWRWNHRLCNWDHGLLCFVRQYPFVDQEIYYNYTTSIKNHLLTHLYHATCLKGSKEQHKGKAQDEHIEEVSVNHFAWFLICLMMRLEERWKTVPRKCQRSEKKSGN